MERIELPFLTVFGEVELSNALQVRLYRRELTLLQVKAASSDVRKDIDSEIYVLKAFSTAIFEKARLLIQRHTREWGYGRSTYCMSPLYWFLRLGVFTLSTSINDSWRVPRASDFRRLACPDSCLRISPQ